MLELESWTDSEDDVPADEVKHNKPTCGGCGKLISGAFCPRSITCDFKDCENEAWPCAKYNTGRIVLRNCGSGYMCPLHQLWKYMQCFNYGGQPSHDGCFHGWVLCAASDNESEE